MVLWGLLLRLLTFRWSHLVIFLALVGKEKVGQRLSSLPSTSSGRLWGGSKCRLRCDWNIVIAIFLVCFWLSLTETWNRTTQVWSLAQISYIFSLTLYCAISPLQKTETFLPAHYLRSCRFITVVRARLKVPDKNSPPLLCLSRGKEEERKRQQSAAFSPAEEEQSRGILGGNFQTRMHNSNKAAGP